MPQTSKTSWKMGGGRERESERHPQRQIQYIVCCTHPCDYASASLCLQPTHDSTRYDIPLEGARRWPTSLINVDTVHVHRCTICCRERESGNAQMRSMDG